MCGSKVTAQAYFVSFQIIGSFVFLNMFIAIILEGFEKVQQEEKMRITDQTLEIFTECWSKYDPHGTRLIKINDLKELIKDLGKEELKIKAGAGREMCVFDLTSSFLLKVWL